MRRSIVLLGLSASALCHADNTFIVNTVADSGGGSLRAAITQMQSGNGLQTIRFEIAGNATIVLTSPLPAMVGQQIALDGSPSPGLRIEGAGWPMFNVVAGGNAQTIRVDQLRLRGGSNASGGGCFNVISTGTLLVFDSTFESCFNSGPPASGAGGGAIRTNGNLRITRSTFTGNASSDGGVVNLGNGGGAVSASNAASVLIERTRFIGNRTQATPANATTCRGGQGGALALSVPAGGSASLVDVQFIDNATLCPSTNSRQAGDGGALALYGFGTTSIVSLDRVYFGRNEAFEAGAIAGYSVRLSVTNTTFFENTAFSSGAIYLLTRTSAPPTSLSLRNSTFARNASVFGSSGAHLTLQNGATAQEIRNTVFAQSVSGPACSPASANVAAGDAVFTSDNTCFFFLPGASESFTSQFVGNTFGLTAATQTYGSVPTLHPPAASALIDNGSNVNCPSLDARGLARPVNGGLAPTCDVGAVEVNPDRIFGTGFEL